MTTIFSNAIYATQLPHRSIAPNTPIILKPSDALRIARLRPKMTDTDQIALDALSALIISNELDAAELLADIQLAQNAELPQIAFALHESLHIAHDHAQRLIDALRTDIALFSELALSLEICPMHTCDLQICIDDQIAECIRFRS
jgi:hypothetical protein